MERSEYLMSETKYIITLNGEQARTVARACEFYSRVLMGQFDEISFEAIMTNLTKSDFGFDKEVADEILFAARRIIFKDLHGRGHSYGIGHNEHGDRAWNAYQSIRYAIAWHDHPEGGITVDFHKPYPAGGEAVPECIVQDGAMPETAYRDTDAEWDSN